MKVIIINESQLVYNLKKWLNSLDGCVAYKIHGNQFQEAGIPDIIGCYYGLFFSIETKVGNNQPSIIQNYQMKRIKKSGGYAFVVTDKTVESFKKEFYAHFNKDGEW